MSNVSFKLLCFRYFSTKVVITMLNSVVYWITCEMDVTCDLLCWVTTILACMLVGLKSLVILLDYRSYMGSSVRIWSLWWLFLYLCSYNLDGSMTHCSDHVVTVDMHLPVWDETRPACYKATWPPKVSKGAREKMELGPHDLERDQGQTPTNSAMRPRSQT
jgi:hypothetical protein